MIPSNFFIPFSIKKESNNTINFSSKIVSLGSCFSQNIGKKLKKLQYNVVSNPFGTLFNPISILKCYQRISKNELLKKEDLFLHQEIWSCFDLSNSFSETNSNTLINKTNEIITNAHEHFKNCDVLIITLGTAWVYEYKKTNEVVTNCFKIPKNNFNQKLLSLESIKNNLQILIDLYRINNPNGTLLFTLSPIRHLKTGVIENNLSKASLLLAIHELCKANKNMGYFPAYEILIDELRDYRFYEKDRMHPTQEAIDYIWSKFEHAFFDESQIQIHKKIEALNNNLNHKVQHPNTQAAKKFALKIEEQKTALAKIIPHFNLQ